MITITEALQEIKTINARIKKKQDSVGNYVARDSRVVDPLSASGGSEEFIKKEMQSISDLRNRIIDIRSLIQYANLTNSLAIAGHNRSVADWLTWRREIASGQKAFTDSILLGIRKLRNEAQIKGGRTVYGNNNAVAENFTAQDPPNIVVNVNETALMKEQEFIETVLGELDGKLSLFNATHTINI